MDKAYISGIGHYLPEKIVTNDDLSKIMDTSNEWIIERTGIQQRHYVSPGQGPSDLAIPATENALKMANLSVKDIDLILDGYIDEGFKPEEDLIQDIVKNC